MRAVTRHTLHVSTISDLVYTMSYQAPGDAFGGRPPAELYERKIYFNEREQIINAERRRLIHVVDALELKKQKAIGRVSYEILATSNISNVHRQLIKDTKKNVETDFHREIEKTKYVLQLKINELRLVQRYANELAWRIDRAQL